MLGIYISIPFCRAKCSFCNFASDVFAADRMSGYVERLLTEVRETRSFARGRGVEVPSAVDTIYFGGGTPSLLPRELIHRLFTGLREQFDIDPAAEITVECAPGQLSDATLEAFQREGMNRLSFGVQSFVDAECSAIGRLHTGAGCRSELRRMAAAGVSRLAVDLIAGLPHQTEASWHSTLDQAIDSGVEHVSIYMLEVDDESRLGRESLAGGKRYGAGALPGDDEVADWYSAACERLDASGLRQYEISNFARPGRESRHNRKYWEREPYLGYGLDAHSMLRRGWGGVRWANADSMTGYLDGLVGLGGIGKARQFERVVDPVGRQEAFEESLFLGLRLSEGVNMGSLDATYSGSLKAALPELLDAGFLLHCGDNLRLTSAGRMASNEVFERLLVPEPNLPASSFKDK